MAEPSNQFDQVDDYQLMEAIAARDENAMRAFYDRHSPLVYALCLRMLRHRQDAEDLLVKVMMEVWESADRYDPARSNPRTYLMMLTRSRAIDAVRKRLPVGAKAFSDDVVRKEEGSAENPASQAERGEDRQRIRRMLEALEPGQRQAIELAYFDGLSHSQIANRLNLPLGTVKSRVRLGLIKLRDQMRSHYTERMQD